ncbi:MAG: hypothetical protein ACK5CY_12120 [Bacteroidia bacterium]|jgi:hypothetical protein
MRILHFTAIVLLFAAYALVKIPGAVLLLKPYGIDLYRLGDLYRYSYLSEYRDSTQTVPYPPQKSKQNIDLYVLGDSYTGSFLKQHYPNISNYSYANWNQAAEQKFTIRTHGSAHNVLLISSAEKSIRLRFSKSQISTYLAKNEKSAPLGFQIIEKPLNTTELLKKYLGRPEITDQNIQALLFENEVALRIQEFKAAINKKVFGKIATEVEEYPEKNMLFQKLTTDPQYVYMSSFKKIEDAEVNQLIDGMKQMALHYKSVGVDSVIFTFIPNPVSVIAPNFNGQTYNQLIPKIENRIHETGAGCISVYHDFVKQGAIIYRRGDTHWNAKGAQLWLDKVNEGLESKMFE